MGQEMLFEIDIEKSASPSSSQEAGPSKRPLEPSEYEQAVKVSGLQNQINKINALDRLKMEQEARLQKHNRAVKSFDELLVDFLVQHDVYSQAAHRVLRNRDAYTGYFLLTVVEMLKYAVKEDYDNARSEINLLPVELTFNKPSKQAKIKKTAYKNLGKKGHKKHKYCDSESESEGGQASEGQESDTEEMGVFYLRFKEAIPALVRKDLMMEDLWLLMKRPIVTNQNLSDVSDMILVKNMWHGPNKQAKLKVAVLGEAQQVKFRAEQYKYAFKSVNLQSYRTLVENLI